MRRWKIAVLLPLLGLAATQAVACYTVYDRTNTVVYQGERAPVDMSRPLHETMPTRFPGGGHLVFDTAAECRVVNSLVMGSGGRTAPSTSPLLTNVETAKNMRVPHSSLGNGIAMVAASNADIRPGLTVVPAQAPTALAGAPDTRVLGAGRAPSSRQPVEKTEIIEYSNPPITVMRRGNKVTILDR